MWNKIKKWFAKEDWLVAAFLLFLAAFIPGGDPLASWFLMLLSLVSVGMYLGEN